MKRMICCAKCAQREVPNYPGEYRVLIHGTAKKTMKCDWCCPPPEIKKGDKCAAESLGVLGHGIPYYPWESEYIEITPGQVLPAQGARSSGTIKWTQRKELVRGRLKG